MPWCEGCAKFWNPNSMAPDGSCPTCGRTLADAADDPRRAPQQQSQQAPIAGPEDLDLRALAGKSAKAPWHFRLMVVALVLYLGWRAVQGVEWAFHRM